MTNKDEKQKRNREIKIRLTDDEFNQIQARKTKPQLATWLRELALAEKPKPRQKTVDPKLLFEINRIGVSVNQIAKKCNQLSPNIDLISVAISLQNIETELKKIIGVSHNDG